jgi:hypothetical protein
MDRNNDGPLRSHAKSRLHLNLFRICACRRLIRIRILCAVTMRTLSLIQIKVARPHVRINLAYRLSCGSRTTMRRYVSANAFVSPLHCFIPPYLQHPP